MCIQITSRGPAELRGTWWRVVHGSLFHREMFTLSSECHFKRALDFHLDVLTVKWCTLKIAWTSTSTCCPCYYSRLCATQPPVGRGGSQDRAEQVAERRLWLSTPKPPPAAGCSRRERQSSRYTAFASLILQPVRLQPAHFHNFLKHFRL